MNTIRISAKLETINKNQTELKNTITEIKNTLEVINCRLDDTEELADRIMEISEGEQKEKKKRTV